MDELEAMNATGRVGNDRDRFVARFRGFRVGQIRQADPYCYWVFRCGKRSWQASPPKGNPYFFTGQRLDLDLRDAATREPKLVLYHYRARAYDAIHGRFLQRDPAGYVDGMNLYEYARSRPTISVDPTGKYNANVHFTKTREWAISEGMKRTAAIRVAQANDDTDRGALAPWPWSEPSRHFNGNSSGNDSRMNWLASEYRRAVDLCATGTDPFSPVIAAIYLGQALHSLQDWWAHGDYGMGNLPKLAWHSYQYDELLLDAVGTEKTPFGNVTAYPNGRAPQVFQQIQLPNDGMLIVQETNWTTWTYGTPRAFGVYADTQRVLQRFLGDVRASGLKKCKCYFLEDR